MTQHWVTTEQEHTRMHANTRTKDSFGNLSTIFPWFSFFLSRDVHSSIRVSTRKRTTKVQIYACTVTLTWESISAFLFLPVLKITKWMDTSVGSIHAGWVKRVGFNLKWKTTPRQRRCSLCICSPSSSSFTMLAFLMGHTDARAHTQTRTPSSPLLLYTICVYFAEMTMKMGSFFLHFPEASTQIMNSMNKCCTWLMLAAL